MPIGMLTCSVSVDGYAYTPMAPEWSRHRIGPSMQPRLVLEFFCSVLSETTTRFVFPS
jgi:hypothetical protein